VVDVFAIGVHEVKGATELSQFTTAPEFPLRVSRPLVCPEQMVVPPLTVPAVPVIPTVTVAVAETAVLHVPFCTTALNCVVCVSAPDV
jgi:hypothetical protein